MTRSKKISGILIGAGIIITISTCAWGVASYWFSYRAEESVHEVKQSENIELAMNQSQLAIIQQRINWLEQRIWEIEREYGCPACRGSIKRVYAKYVEEYKALQLKIQQLMK